MVTAARLGVAPVVAAAMIEEEGLSNEALAGVKAPMLVIVGGRDVMINSEETCRRLARHAPKARVIHLPEARHFIQGQDGVILDFLSEGGARVPQGMPSLHQSPPPEPIFR